MKIYIHLANKSFFYFFLQNDPIKLGVGKYQCPFCPMIMSQNGTMKRHIMVHTGEKPFKCQLCQYASGRKASLQHHIQHIHGLFSNWEQNSFLWNIMIYFDQKYIDLKKSIVFCKYIVFIILQNEPIQLGNHQFACPFCTKIMKLKADVKRHIRTHTGEKPYACKFCPYRSSQKGTLQYHVQHIHGDYSNWKEFNICCLLAF